MVEIKKHYRTNAITSVAMGQTIEEILTAASSQRMGFERRWYDNNFFDDGYHFRYLSRTQNKIVDLSERQNIWAPIRAIPKASRQIRGVANLLVSRDFVPVIYPERVNKIQFTDPAEYKLALESAKNIAKRSGHWVEEEMRNQDIVIKIAQMVILAAKHGVSYMQVWPDAVTESIKTSVLDAFDVYLDGTVTDIEDSPYIIKAIPKFISEIKANENFDSEQLEKINPDNKQASSEIKNAYMSTRFAKMTVADATATIIQKEAFIKEYLNEETRERIRLMGNEDVIKDKKDGDMVMRHTFVAGNITLRDEYLDMPSYPIVDFRFEPGPMYQVPLIERFIPANKSLDMLLSRAERYAHTMVVGTWLKQKGQQFNITNQAGGQIIEYEGTPPVQGQMASIPSFFFDLIGYMQGLIEEQGVTTTTLGKLPKGVKGQGAIESLKESEYANLVIADRRLKDTLTRIAEKFLDIADDYFVEPQTVYYLEKGEPQYFDVIGAGAKEKREKEGIPAPADAVPLKKDYKVEIEITSAPAYTRDGQRQVLVDLMDRMIQLSQIGAIPPEALKVVTQQFLETFQFGATAEIMDAIEEYGMEGSMTEDQISALKVAIMEVFKDLQKAGMLPSEEERIQEAKVANLEVMKETGGKQEETKPPSRSISFKDMPAEGKIQMAQQAGIQLSPEAVIQQDQMEAAKVAVSDKGKVGESKT
jgi:hypothetical protein